MSIRYEEFWHRFFYRCDVERIQQWQAREDEALRQSRLEANCAVKSAVSAQVAMVTLPYHVAKWAVTLLFCSMLSSGSENCEDALKNFEQNEDSIQRYTSRRLSNSEKHGSIVAASPTSSEGESVKISPDVKAIDTEDHPPLPDTQQGNVQANVLAATVKTKTNNQAKTIEQDDALDGSTSSLDPAAISCKELKWSASPTSSVVSKKATVVVVMDDDNAGDNRVTISGLQTENYGINSLE
jgi:hypothetical protein